MIRGRVAATLEPVIELGLKQGDTVIVIPALIDTGFSGLLCLAERYVAQIDLTFLFNERYELANGEVVVQDVFATRIVWDGREQEVELIMTASQDTLVGAELLQPYTLTIDYPRQQVRLTKHHRRKHQPT